MKDNEIELDKSVQENMVNAIMSALKIEEKKSKIEEKKLTNATIIDGFKATLIILLFGGILAAGCAVIVKMIFFIIGV